MPRATLAQQCPNGSVYSPSSHTHSSAQEKIKFFLSVFKGREDVYARRYHSAKTGKSGYTPACRNEWVPGLCDKKKHRCPDCPNREFQPLTAGVIKVHLLGRDPMCRDVAAIYPMLEDNTTWLLAADFDEENWQLDVTAFCKSCMDMGLAAAVERSRSGNGAHVWFFFSEPVPAADARRLGTGLLTRTMACRHELSFSSYDRLFPSQDIVPKGGFGNLIALPFQGQAQKDGNSLFVDESFVPYADQWAYLSSLPKITSAQLVECLQTLCRDGDMGDLADPSEKQAPWQRKRTRQKLTRRDFPLQVTLTLSNLVYVDKNGFSQAALNVLKRLAAFPNPEFRAKQAMRLPVFGVPRVLDCGYEDTDYIGLPRGCVDALIELLEHHGVPAILDDRRCVGRSIDVSFKGTLREEQAPAAQALLSEDIGVLSATTAFGKTVIGAYLIGQRRVNTLILVQSSALLEQWKSSLEQFLDIREVLPEPPKKRGRKKKLHLIGQIGSGKNAHSGIIDIAIMQSLFEGEDKTVKSFVAEYGMVIVDECHHIAAFTFEQVLKSVEAKCVYGLSATPIRKDGHHPIIFMQCGPVRYLVDAKSQAEKRTFAHFVIPRFTRTRLPNAADIQDMYAGVIGNESRNELLVSDTLKLLQEGRTPILLTERKEHAALLASQLSDKVKNLFLLIGSDKQYVDVHVPMLERMYHKRLKGYAELGYQVKFGAADEPVSMIYNGHASMVPVEQDLTDAARSIVIVSPYLQKGRLGKLLPLLQKALSSGIDIVLHTKDADGYEPKYQEAMREAITMLKQSGISVHVYKELQQRYAVIDESIVWYGSVDFLAYGRKDTDVLRFVNPDIAGELLALWNDEPCEQLTLSDTDI